MTGSLFDVEDYLCLISVWRDSGQFHYQCVQQWGVCSQNYMFLLTDSILQITRNQTQPTLSRVFSDCDLIACN